MDSTLNFVDAQSEENYQFLFSKMSNNPNSSMFISLKDSVTYLFDDNIQYKEFVAKRIGRNNFNGNKIKIKSGGKKRKDITNKFVGVEDRLDSGISKNNFIYNKDVYEGYSLEGMIGSFRKENLNNANSSESARWAWRESGNSTITLYEHSYFGGSSYEVLSASGLDFLEYESYIMNVSAFNDKTSSFIVNNATTRRMIVTFWEHPNAGGAALGFDITPRFGNTIYQYYAWNLQQTKLNPNCWIFCKKWNDRISSVSATWYRPTILIKKPRFIDVINANVVIDYPYEYEWGSYEIANLTLQKSSSSNWWNAGASSLGQAGNRYGAEYQIDSRNTDIMFGLSFSNQGGAGWNTIDYNLYVSKYRGNVIQIWQSGNYRATYPFAYEVGDVITVVNHWTFVGFYHNNYFIGSLSHNSAPLYLDNSIYNANAVIRKINQ